MSGSQPSRRRGARYKKENKKGKIITTILLLVCIGVFVFALSNIILITLQNSSDYDLLKDLMKLAGVEDNIKDDDSVLDSIIDSSSNLDSDTSPIKEVGVDEINLNNIDYLNVNLAPLLERNKETVGWFNFSGPDSIKGLPINGPLLQHSDNDYYLNKDFDGSNNENGSIYVDYRCDMNDITSNRNTIIYGHARSYKKFGGLKYLNEAKRWYMDANNHFIKITTGNKETVWQVFSWYETTASDPYRQVNFSSSEDFISYADNLQSKNKISALKQFKFNENDKILTLSTCKGITDKNKRVAVHAVLVKSRNIS